MPPYSAIILEDDPQAAASIAAKMASSPFAGDIVAKWVRSPSEMRESFDMEGLPDILVADIVMADGGKNGIQAVRELVDGSGCETSTQVIYATGYVEYCTEVYDTEHVCFLLKPIEQSELDKALARAVGNIETARNRRISISQKGSTYYIDPAEVDYVESRLRKLLFHASDETFETYGTMTNASDTLPGGFVRCHKSFIVNIDAVRKVGPSELVLRTGRTVPLGKRYREDVKREMACFYSRRVGKTDE